MVKYGTGIQISVTRYSEKNIMKTCFSFENDGNMLRCQNHKTLLADKYTCFAETQYFINCDKEIKCIVKFELCLQCNVAVFKIFIDLCKIDNNNYSDRLHKNMKLVICVDFVCQMVDIIVT